nr:retrovirus-related Pol polyprotein from transposon TNT 1-94 [Tanacetum cinerariifolium]
MRHINTQILKENKNLRTKLKELTTITETRLNSTNKVNQCITKQIPSQKKRILGVDQVTKDPSSSGQKDLVFVKSLADDTKVSIPGVERPWLSEPEGFILPNHDTGRILLAESQRNLTDPLIAVTDSSSTDYDSADEYLICSTSLPPLKKLDAPVKGNKSSSASKVNSPPADGHNRIISLRRGIKPRNPQHVMKSYETCGTTVHTTTDHNYIEWFKRDSGCSRHMTGVKSYLHKYIEQPRPNVVFEDDSTCTTKGYGSIKCNGIVFTKVAIMNGLKYNLISISQFCDAKYIVQFDEKRGTIFNSNKEVVMIAPRIRDVYVLDMTLSAQESCFFSKVSDNLNWLWHKRLANLNFKTINKLAKQNLVIGLPSLVYLKDKSCSSCEKGKHHWAIFKTKQTSSIKKCLHLLHMDLFGPVTPRNSILVNFCDEKEIFQNFSSPYTPEQNVYIHNHKDYLRKFNEKADDGYLIGYALVSKAFRVFNTRRQQTKETYHITFDESPDAIKFSKPLVDNFKNAENERYPPNEYLYLYEPS